MTKNWKKFTAEKKFNFFCIKNYSLSLGLHKRRPSYKRSLQLSKENIQHFKTWNFVNLFYFCGSFLPSWIRIPNKDPLTWLNQDPIWIRIRNPVFYKYVPLRKKSSRGKRSGCPPACWRRGWRAGRGRGGSCRCSKYSYSASVTSQSSTTSQPDREYFEENIKRSRSLNIYKLLQNFFLCFWSALVSIGIRIQKYCLSKDMYQCRSL